MERTLLSAAFDFDLAFAFDVDLAFAFFGLAPARETLKRLLNFRPAQSHLFLRRLARLRSLLKSHFQRPRISHALARQQPLDSKNLNPRIPVLQSRRPVESRLGSSFSMGGRSFHADEHADLRILPFDDEASGPCGNGGELLRQPIQNFE